MILVYDTTFEGFLTLVHEVYYKKYKPHAIHKKDTTPNLLDEIIDIEYNEQKSTKVFQGMKKLFCKNEINRIMNIFLCDNEAFEMQLLGYIKIGFKDKNELKNINHREVFYIQNLHKELMRNTHKYSGFLRFAELEDGTLYAKIESKFSLVYLLGIHFSKRLNNQNYIIHDIERALAFVKFEDNKSVRNVADFDMPVFSNEEQKFEKLWQTFFKAIAIESRSNKNLQRSLVPLIYRKYMNEFLNN